MIPFPILHPVPSGFGGLIAWEELELYLREGLDMALATLAQADADKPGAVGRAQAVVAMYLKLLELPGILHARRHAAADALNP